MRYARLLIVVLACCAAPVLAADRPNILWLIAEDLSPDLACYGDGVVHTPHLDRLAGEGVRYTRMFTVSGICSPSRTALAVGTMQTTIGAYHMRYPDGMSPPLPTGMKTIPELMQDAGYATANLRYADKLGGSGKDDWMFAGRQRKQWTLSEWDQLERNQPFYAQVNFRLTHRPWARDAERPVDPAKVTLPPYYPDTPLVRSDWASYLESVQVLDRQIGDVLSRLRASGLDRNTIVVFVSDHGRPFTRAKQWLFDSSTRVPFIVRWPQALPAPAGYEAGATRDRLLMSIDLAATTLAWAGADRPAWMQGRVFLADESDDPRDAVFAAVDRVGEIDMQCRSVRTARYRYLRNEDMAVSINEASTAYRKALHPIYHVLRKWDREGRLNPAQRTLVGPLPPEQLFDLEADPHETRNLVDDPAHADALADLRKRLAEWRERTGDQGVRPDPPQIVEAFEAYGKTSAERNAARIEKLREAVEAEP